MNIYVLPRGKADEFKNLCESISLRPNITDKQFTKAGCSNYYEPIFYFCKGLACEDKYPVSFDIQVVKKTRKIKSIGVLDEQFLQPHYVNESLLNQIKSHVHKLVEFGILEYTRSDV